jgi:site-specific recombinase XerD
MGKGFQSILASEMEAFMRFKQNLGQPYIRGFTTLRSFDAYVAEHHQGRQTPDWQTLLSGWLGRRPARKSGTVSCELGTIRQFCLFRRRSDPGGFVPDSRWAPQRTGPRFLPEVLSGWQAAQLIKRTGQLKDLPLRRSGMRALICVLYSTGLRLGEALRLRWADLHWKERCLFIRMSKGRSRWVPFRIDLRQELEHYVQERRRYVGDDPESFLFCRADGSAYSVLSASGTIRQLLRQAGFKPAAGRCGPRPHDLRHGLARERLHLWYRAGADLQRRLPDLSVYLGHQNLLGTEIYLKASSDLLAVVGRRMAAHFRKACL